MERKVLFIILATLLGGLLFLTGTALANQHGQNRKTLRAPTVGIEDASYTSAEVPVGGPQTTLALQAPRRISIPYGFADHLPLSAGKIITASGHGGCTEGEEVTVDVTITQTLDGPLLSASGQFTQTCTGQLQTWTVALTADPGSTFVDGPATACGVATTRDQYGVTDVYRWCKAVRLNWQLYLPLTTGE